VPVTKKSPSWKSFEISGSDFSIAGFRGLQP